MLVNVSIYLSTIVSIYLSAIAMRTYGRTPVIAGRFEGTGYEMIDGFKRLRAIANLNALAETLESAKL